MPAALLRSRRRGFAHAGASATDPMAVEVRPGGACALERGRQLARSPVSQPESAVGSLHQFPFQAVIILGVNEHIKRPLASTASLSRIEA